MISSGELCVAPVSTSLRLVQRPRNISESISNSFTELPELRPPKDCAVAFESVRRHGRLENTVIVLRNFFMPRFSELLTLRFARKEYPSVRSRLDSSAIKNTFELFTRMSYHRNIFPRRGEENGDKGSLSWGVKKNITAR